MIESQTATGAKRRAWTLFYNRDLWAIGFILVVTLTFFYKLILFGKTFWGADIEFFFYPTRAAWAQALSEGDISSILWSPYIFGGYPLFAEGQTGALYPPNLLFGLPIFSSLTVYNLQIVFHYFLAGVFTYSFARVIKVGRGGALVSAISFTFSGFMVSHLSHMSLMNAAVWLPLIFLFTELFLAKGQWRFLLLASLALGVQICAGHPQAALMTILVLGGYIFFHVLFFTGEQGSGIHLPALPFPKTKGRLRTLRVLASKLVWFVVVLSLLVAIGVSVAAGQLLPLFELTSASGRAGGGVSYAMAASFSLPTQNLGALLFPFHFGGPVADYRGEGVFAELALYVGVLPFVLAVVSLFLKPNRYTVVFFSLGAICLLLALGDATPLFKILHSFPIYGGLRAPARFVLIVDFALAVLAGFGATNLYRTEKLYNRRRILFFAVLILLLVFIFFASDSGLGRYVRESLKERSPSLEASLPPSPVPASRIERDWPNSVFLPLVARTAGMPSLIEFAGGALSALWRDKYRFASYLFLLVSAVTLFLGYKKRATVWIPALSIALVVVDLFLFTKRVNAYLVFDSPVPGETHERIVEFLRTTGGSNRVYNISGHPSNSLLPLQISSLDGYSPLQLKRHRDYEAALKSSRFDTSLLSLGSVRYVVDYVGRFRQVAERENCPVAYETGTVKVYENKAALPRAFIVFSATIENGNDPLELLRQTVLDPTKVAVLEKEFDVSRLSGSGEATVDIADYAPTKVTIRASLNSNGFLVLNDTYYPGWEVFVDGTKSEVYRANYLFRAVFLPPGNHTVKFVYRPVFLRLGIIVSLLTLSGIVGGFIKIMVLPRIRRAQTPIGLTGP